MNAPLRSFFDTPPGADQQAALDALEAFLHDPAQHVFLLQGYAGSGKTYLIRGLARYLKARDQPFALMAPTGRAAMVLRQRTGFEAGTIHRSIYRLDQLIPFRDGEDVRFRFPLTTSLEMDNGMLAVVDEASMLSNLHNEHEYMVFGSGFLLDDLMALFNPAETRRKLIFSGDPAQLPPVGMNFSPALDIAYLQERYRVRTAGATLRQVLRQGEGSAILALAGELRDQIESGTRIGLSFRPEPGSEAAPASLQDIPQAYLDEAYAPEGDPKGAIVTYSNAAALRFNQQIRLLRDGSHLPVQTGELLLVMRNNYRYEQPFFNGQLVRVAHVSPETIRRTVRFKSRSGPAERTLVFRSISIMPLEQDREPGTGGAEYEFFLLEPFLEDPGGQLQQLDQQALYVDFRMRHPNWEPDAPMAADILRADPFYHALQAKYGYAMTCHKAQGGEWPTVWADLASGPGGSGAAYLRWAYTAVTRARSQLYMTRRPPGGRHKPLSVLETFTLTGIPAGFYYMPPEAAGGPPEAAFLEPWRNAVRLAAQTEDFQLDLQPLSYRERMQFRKDGIAFTLDQQYSKKGLTSLSLFSGSAEAAQPVMDAIRAIQPPVHRPPAPDLAEPFRRDLWDQMTEAAEACGAQLTHYQFAPYQDTYFLQCGGACKLDFSFDAEGRYTTLRPASVLGPADAQLQELIRLILPFFNP
ncbi:MAG: AAA family ATPase [Bacteroidia bacterium]|nr:AAA family ATPase [Bacteroidia bacterium]